MEELNKIETIEEVNVLEEGTDSTETTEEGGAATAVLIGLTTFAAIGAVLGTKLVYTKVAKPLWRKGASMFKKVKTVAVDEDGKHVDAEVVDDSDDFMDETEE